MVHPSKFSTEMDPLAPRSDMPCTLFTMMSSEYDGKKEAKEAKHEIWQSVLFLKRESKQCSKRKPPRW